MYNTSSSTEPHLSRLAIPTYNDQRPDECVLFPKDARFRVYFRRRQPEGELVLLLPSLPNKSEGLSRLGPNNKKKPASLLRLRLSHAESQIECNPAGHLRQIRQIAAGVVSGKSSARAVPCPGIRLRPREVQGLRLQFRPPSGDICKSLPETISGAG